MEIGLVGKPNVGKSTFFSALTMASAEIASYPFTTIEPNRGMAYVRAKCPHTEFGVECNPVNSKCVGGTRFIPVEVIDVAGLVPKAHEGRGLGNKFLDDLRQASALIHIVDASGSTDAEGRLCNIGERDPCEDVLFLEEEIDYWIAGILARDWQRIARRAEAEGIKLDILLHDKLTGLGVRDADVHYALKDMKTDKKPREWGEEELLEFAGRIRRRSKPILIAANKADIAPEHLLNRLRECTQNATITSAEYELALRKASAAGLIDYRPGDEDFRVVDEGALTEAQKRALQKIRDFMKRFGGTGVQECIERAVYDMLGMIVVYPVEDENHLTDKDGNVLPDAYLMPKGSTALDLAYKVHTDLGENFIRAINARTKRVVGHDYELKNGDIIKIVAKA